MPKKATSKFMHSNLKTSSKGKILIEHAKTKSKKLIVTVIDIKSEVPSKF
jgi:hypothetical protein